MVRPPGCTSSSGDGGRFDEDGYLILLDRKEGRVISGGLNVYPSDISRCCASTDVRSRGGRRPLTMGRNPVAFVVPRQAAPPDALLEWTNERVESRSAWPLEVVDSCRAAVSKVLSAICATPGPPGAKSSGDAA
jgi:acyl-CoA synthetase (AMP-forming)/AMP-acid ligase II